MHTCTPAWPAPVPWPAHVRPHGLRMYVRMACASQTIASLPKANPSLPTTNPSPPHSKDLSLSLQQVLDLIADAAPTAGTYFFTAAAHPSLKASPSASKQLPAGSSAPSAASKGPAAAIQLGADGVGQGGGVSVIGAPPTREEVGGGAGWGLWDAAWVRFEGWGCTLGLVSVELSSRCLVTPTPTASPTSTPTPNPTPTPTPPPHPHSWPSGRPPSPAMSAGAPPRHWCCSTTGATGLGLHHVTRRCGG